MDEIMTEDTYLSISLIKHEPDSIHLYIHRIYYKLKCSLLVGWKKTPEDLKKELDAKILQKIILGRNYSY